MVNLSRTEQKKLNINDKKQKKTRTELLRRNGSVKSALKPC